MTTPMMRVEFRPGEARIVDFSRQIKEGVVVGVNLVPRFRISGELVAQQGRIWIGSVSFEPGPR